MPVAGGTETLLDTGFNDPYNTAINRAGTSIIYSSLSFMIDLYQIGINGGASSQISDGLSDADWPCFSPDGASVLFTGDATGTPQLYVMSANGGVPTQLTNLPDGATMGRFSPDGTKIVFVSGATSDDVYVMNANGSGVTQLTSGSEDETEPTFSPDGQKIVYVKDMGGGNGFNGQLWIMNATGGGALQLTNTLQDDEEPCFTSDGSLVIFSRSSGAGRELYKIAPGGGAATPLTSDGATASAPSTGW